MRRHRKPRGPAGAVFLLGFLLIGCVGQLAPPASAAESSEDAAQLALAQGKLDINRASEEQILALPVPEDVAAEIFTYREFVRYFTDIYDLLEVPGMKPKYLVALKPVVAVLPPPEQDLAVARMSASYRQVRNYLGQEGSNEGLVDEYLDLLQEPSNVNEMDIFDLMSFQNVSPVDATKIIQARERLGGFTSGRQLRRSEGLRYYAYRNLRDFVVYSPTELGAEDPVKVDYQVRYYDTPIYDGDDDNEAVILGKDSQLVNPHMSHKLKANLPHGWRAGARTYRGLGEQKWDETAKAFIEVRNKNWGGFHLKRAVAGNYRVAFGAGLIMDNTDFIHFRKTGYGWNKRPLGVRSDLSRSDEYALTGGAVEGRIGRFHLTAFGSHDERDGILNPDGTVNRYVIMKPRPQQSFFDERKTESNQSTGLKRDAFRENLYGGNAKFMIAPGAFIGATVMQSNYDRGFDSRPETLIEGGDGSTYWEARDSEIEAGYTSVFIDSQDSTRTEYKWRRIYGAEAQVVINNVSVQGEYAWLQDPREGFLKGDHHDALIVNTFAQVSDNLHLLAIYRDYDIGFDNPYMRSFSNDRKYEQTILDSSYRLDDELYNWLAWTNPQPKGEKGLFMDMRYRVSRQFIINGLSYDQWERKSDGADMNRWTAKLEYQPKFNLRFRVRQRVSSRTEQNPQDVRTFKSWETRFQMIALLSNYNRLSLTYMTSNVNYPARQRLAYPAESQGGGSAVGGAASPAYAFEAKYEHNLTPWIKLSYASSIYDGFFWNFEGNEFVLLDDNGFRNWFKVESRISERMLFQLKVTKDHKMPRTNTENRQYGVPQDPYPVNYAPADDLYVRMQIDYSF